MKTSDLVIALEQGKYIKHVPSQQVYIGKNLFTDWNISVWERQHEFIIIDPKTIKKNNDLIEKLPELHSGYHVEVLNNRDKINEIIHKLNIKLSVKDGI